MKYRKQCYFVKAICEELHIEIITSRITILEFCESEGETTEVIFEDRFGERYTAYYSIRGKPTLLHLMKKA